MSEQVTVKSAHTSTSATTLVTGAAYLKSVNCLGTSTAGVMRFYDGTSASGTLLLELDVPGNSNTTNTVLIPGPGILFNTGIHVTFPTGYNVTVFYGLN